jgi:hypothetical protein
VIGMFVLDLAGCCFVNAQTTQVPRHPQGVYVLVGPVVLGSKVINPGPDQAADADLLAKNPGVAGLSVYVQWSVLNPNPPKDNRLPDSLDCSKLKGHTDPTDPYDWSLIDAAFCAAASASPPRTITLIVRPGFYTPQWVLDQINSNSCSGQFVFLSEPYYVPASPLPPLPPNPTPACHLAYFADQEGLSVPAGQSLYRPLPMPWDATYKNAWRGFLMALNARYGQNPAFVAISVAGPTAESTEILLPSGTQENKEWSTLFQNQYSDPRYWNSDQAFIDEWKNSIDMYGQVFNGVTLGITLAFDLLEFPGPYTLPPGGDVFCTDDPFPMACGAISSIVSYFEQPGAGGRNGREFSNDGLHARSDFYDKRVKLIAESTAPSTRILGGYGFAGGLGPYGDLATIRMLCPDATAATPACSTHQAFYNTIANFFNGTPASALVPRLYDPATIALFPGLAGGTQPGGGPLNDLKVYVGDIITSTTPVVVDTGESVNPFPSFTGQQLLNLAAQGLAMTAETPLPVAIPTPEGIINDLNQLQASGAITLNTDSLLDKLNRAREDGDGHDCGDHGDSYKAFIDEVLDRTGSGITPAAASVLIGDALYLEAHCQ